MRIKAIQVVAFCLSFVLLYGCYKDDVQDLYSRQYLTSVGLKELDEKAGEINKELKEIRTLIEKLKLGEPTTKVEYNIVNGDTLGVYLYFGKTKVYVPFGKKGKDGTQITIGEDGYWYINGEKTDKKASGADGCTPQIGVAQDPDNTSDTKLYWQVMWCDGTKKFILHEGKKVPARGEDGKPGVVNPIKKIEVKDGKVIITTTYEDMPTVEIPLLPDAFFQIYPERIISAASDQSASSSPYHKETNSLQFTTPGQTLQMPYDLQGELLEIEPIVPEGWSVAVDKVQKMIRITAPSREDMPQFVHDFVLQINAYTPTGNVFGRRVKVILNRYIFIDYFYNFNPEVETAYATSGLNTISFEGVKGHYVHFRNISLLDREPNRRMELKVLEEKKETELEQIKKVVKSSPSVVIAKTNPEIDSNKMLQQTDFFFNSDSLEVDRPTTVDDPRKIGYYRLKHKDANVRAGETCKFVPPINDNTYIGYSTYKAGSRSDVRGIRLKKAGAKIRFKIKKVKELLGLPKGETFDVNKLIFRYPSASAIYADPKYLVDRKDSHPDIIVCEVPVQKYQCAKYDAAKDLLEGEFTVLPIANSKQVGLMLVYPKNGSVNEPYRKLLTALLNIEPVSEGYIVDYYWKTPHPSEPNDEDGYIFIFDGVSEHGAGIWEKDPDKDKVTDWK